MVKPERLPCDWPSNSSTIAGVSYTCGFCGTKAGPSFGYRASNIHAIYICPMCNRPTFVVLKHSEGGQEQTPGPKIGVNVGHLPNDVDRLYDEIRRAFQVEAYSLAVLGCRKMLMHIGVEKGADEGKSFQHYVDHLNNAGYIPPDGKAWVDLIRSEGNIQNHEIVVATKEGATKLLTFVEMLLRFVYEFPKSI